jgi:hypothetical protein
MEKENMVRFFYFHEEVRAAHIYPPSLTFNVDETKLPVIENTDPKIPGLW